MGSRSWIRHVYGAYMAHATPHKHKAAGWSRFEYQDTRASNNKRYSQKIEPAAKPALIKPTIIEKSKGRAAPRRSFAKASPLHVHGASVRKEEAPQCTSQFRRGKIDFNRGFNYCSTVHNSAIVIAQGEQSFVGVNLRQPTIPDVKKFLGRRLSTIAIRRILLMKS